MIPNDLQATCDEVVAAFHAGKEIPVSLEKIKEWLACDGWDELISDLGEQMAINLGFLSHFDFDENELRSELDIPKTTHVSDQDRITWGRDCINRVLNEYDGYLLPSIHTFELKASDGSTAIMGCLVEIHGQLGPVTNWRGLWSTRDEFLQSLRKDNEYWVTPLMGDVPDEVILSLWNASKPRSGRASGKSSQC